MFQTYFKEIQKHFLEKESTEHTYRTALETLLNQFKDQNLSRKLSIIHEPVKQGTSGRPDYKIRTKEDLTIGFIETKKIGEKLSEILKSAQLKKYEKLSDNIIVTDYINFILIKNGAPVLETSLCSAFNLENKRYKIEDTRIQELSKMLRMFFESEPMAIYKVQDLALKLSNKAIFLKDYAEEVLLNSNNTRLHALQIVFTKSLLPNLKAKEFADIYAQTITYGLFLAALNCNDPGKELNKTSAYDLLPKTFPLIKELFHQLENFPEEIIWAIDEIISILKVTDVTAIKKEFAEYRQKEKGFTDPYIYFYEDFLKHYDRTQKKIRGVYYTPEPVVSFIVRSVEQILKDEFDIKDGYINEKVTVLDFAAGTGTFLLDVFRHAIEEAQKIGDKETVKKIVNERLVKNFYGFELLVAPYAIAHLKISEYLKESGYELKDGNRLKIYLTNTLSNKEPEPFPLMENLSEEGKEANKVKNKPILVILGNPPYSVSSQNKTGFIADDKMNRYKEAVRTEKNIQPLSDDYIKFIRFAHWKMENVDQGIIGIITNNSFLDGLIHRGMREELLKDFNKIYILNLHGNSLIGEKCLDGSKDENVFDIQQGVSISFFIKSINKTTNFSEVFYKDLFGIRDNKYFYLLENKALTMEWESIEPQSINYFFTKFDFKNLSHYQNGHKINDIYNIFTSGIKTHNDNNLVSFIPFKNNNKKYNYRPFDIRFIEYDINKVVRHRFNVMQHLLKDNIALVTKRKLYENHNNFFVTKYLSDIRLASSPGTLGSDYVFPLYIYQEEEKEFFGVKESELNYNNGFSNNRKPNFTKEFTEFIKSKYKTRPEPEQILGYIYAVLHSPTYREKYIEFLKIDFPRIPFTDDENLFFELAGIGFELIEHHLMKKSYSENICTMKGTGDNFLVSDVKYDKGKVWINTERYFEPVPEDIWEFYIGGYQVLEKWLKERKKHSITLNADDIQHFIKVVNILDTTIKTMNNIDELTKDWI